MRWYYSRQDMADTRDGSLFLSSWKLRQQSIRTRLGKCRIVNGAIEFDEWDGSLQVCLEGGEQCGISRRIVDADNADGARVGSNTVTEI